MLLTVCVGIFRHLKSRCFIKYRCQKLRLSGCVRHYGIYVMLIWTPFLGSRFVISVRSVRVLRVEQNRTEL
jgi:hypothetical protein